MGGVSLLYSALQPQTGDVQTAGEAVHAAAHRVVRLPQRLVDRRDHKVLQHLDVLGIDRLGLDGERGDLLLAVCRSADGTAADARCEGGLLDLLLSLRHLLLHLHELLLHLHLLRRLSRAVREAAARAVTLCHIRIPPDVT